MINHNSILYSILDRKFSQTFGTADWVVNYTEGDLFEIVRKLNDSKVKYPIIWLQTGYKVERNEQHQKTRILNPRIFIITKGNQHDRYEARFESNYQEMLYPILNKMLNVFSKKSGVNYSKTYTFTTFPFNDTTEMMRRESKYGNKTEPQTATLTDIWDALLLELPFIELADDCFSEFNI